MVSEHSDKHVPHLQLVRGGLRGRERLRLADHHGRHRRRCDGLLLATLPLRPLTLLRDLLTVLGRLERRGYLRRLLLLPHIILRGAQRPTHLSISGRPPRAASARSAAAGDASAPPRAPYRASSSLRNGRWRPGGTCSSSAASSYCRPGCFKKTKLNGLTAAYVLHASLLVTKTHYTDVTNTEKHGDLVPLRF